MKVAVLVEAGTKRTFAVALDWPGWARSGKTEEQALEALLAYAPRYAEVAAAAGLEFPAAEVTLDVVERVKGGGGTDFGVPGEVVDHDRQRLDAGARKRLRALVEAAWSVFDEVVKGAPPGLRKGPRGGGRDRDQVVEHVYGAEDAYGRKFGVRITVPKLGDAAALGAARRALLDGLESGEGGPKGWPGPYAARRIAWHALDHAWEIQDRSEGQMGAGG
jgi:hypothetical protein